MTVADEAHILVGELLIETGLTLSVAESCTGGLVGHLLTEVPGSSRYYYGGVVAYDDSVKIGLLRVPAALIRQYGAVSAECALEMARLVRLITNTDIGISVTGIAGPSGGTEAKPVGTVFIGLSAEGVERVEHYHWQGNRSENKQQSAQAALQMLIDFLTEPVAPGAIQEISNTKRS